MSKPSSLVPLMRGVAAQERIDRRRDEELAARSAKSTPESGRVDPIRWAVDHEADRRVVGVDRRDARAGRRRDRRDLRRRLPARLEPIEALYDRSERLLGGFELLLRLGKLVLGVGELRLHGGEVAFRGRCRAERRQQHQLPCAEQGSDVMKFQWISEPTGRCRSVPWPARRGRATSRAPRRCSTVRVAAARRLGGSAGRAARRRGESAPSAAEALPPGAGSGGVPAERRAGRRRSVGPSASAKRHGTPDTSPCRAAGRANRRRGTRRRFACRRCAPARRPRGRAAARAGAVRAGMRCPARRTHGARRRVATERCIAAHRIYAFRSRQHGVRRLRAIARERGEAIRSPSGAGGHVPRGGRAMTRTLRALAWACVSAAILLGGLYALGFGLVTLRLAAEGASAPGGNVQRAALHALVETLAREALLPHVALDARGSGSCSRAGCRAWTPRGGRSRRACRPARCSRSRSSAPSRSRPGLPAASPTWPARPRSSRARCALALWLGRRLVPGLGPGRFGASAR